MDILLLTLVLAGAPAGGDLLWDNRVETDGEGVISTQPADLDAAAAVQAADDFVVGTGLTWSIERIEAVGFSGVSAAGGPAPDAFAVRIYGNDGGRPGTLLFEETGLAARRGAPTGVVDIVLPTPVDLATGTYWLSVLGVFDGAEGVAPDMRWNWSTGAEPRRADWHVRDAAGTATAPTDWTPARALRTPQVSTVFALFGAGGDGDVLFADGFEQGGR